MTAVFRLLTSSRIADTAGAGLVVYAAADGLGSVALMIESGTLTPAGIVAATLYAASYAFLAVGLARIINAIFHHQ